MRIDVKTNGFAGLSAGLSRLSEITNGFSIIFDGSNIRLHTANKTWTATVGDNNIEQIYLLVLDVLSEIDT